MSSRQERGSLRERKIKRVPFGSGQFESSRIKKKRLLSCGFSFADLIHENLLLQNDVFLDECRHGGSVS